MHGVVVVVVVGGVVVVIVAVVVVVEVVVVVVGGLVVAVHCSRGGAVSGPPIALQEDCMLANIWHSSVTPS